jgi:hypothetical protein
LIKTNSRGIAKITRLLQILGGGKNRRGNHRDRGSKQLLTQHLDKVLLPSDRQEKSHTPKKSVNPTCEKRNIIKK